MRPAAVPLLRDGGAARKRMRMEICDLQIVC